MKFNAYLLILLFTSFNLYSKEVCHLDSSEKLIIACTKKCNHYYISALLDTSNKLDYKIKIITLNQNNQNFDAKLSNIDGIVSPGGHDILPKYFTTFLSEEEKKRKIELFKKYGKSNKKGEQRDFFEYNLINYILQNNSFKDMPFLGICYGMQMLAATKGIPLYVDIKQEIGVASRRKINDRIYLKYNTKFSKFVNRRYISGYKNHHQAIDLKYFNRMKNDGYYKNITISGISNQGKIAEILEFTNRPIIGIQFHAERSSELTKEKVYSYFLINACIRKKHKLQKGNKK